MNRKNNSDDVMCVVCDLWWLWLLMFLLLIAVTLLRSYWMPYIFPQPTAAPVFTQSPPVVPESTTSLPTLTPVAVPTMGTGDIQATLRWNNLNDLDLHVTDPAGNEIFFGNKSSPTGGLLDVDNNAGCDERMSERPVENIYWPSGSAPSGEYLVSVVLFEQCDSFDSSAFSVTVVVDGVTKTFSGEVSNAKPKTMVYRFTR